MSNSYWRSELLYGMADGYVVVETFSTFMYYLGFIYCFVLLGFYDLLFWCLSWLHPEFQLHT